MDEEADKRASIMQYVSEIAKRKNSKTLSDEDYDKIVRKMIIQWKDR